MPVKLQEAIDHQNIPSPPDGSVRVWRFMALPKFLDLLVERKLFFVQMEKLRKADAFENTLPKFNADHARKITSDQDYAEAYFQNFDKRHLESLREYEGEVLTKKMLDYQTKSTYVNCWHESEYEPQGLWKLYASEHDGIAIKSTFGSLVSSLDESDPHWVYPGRIEYVNFESARFDRHNSLHAMYRKRVNFEFEKEVRFTCSHHSRDDGHLFDRAEGNPPGIKIGLDVSRAIEEVRVGPNCESWVLDTIRNVTRSLGYSFEILRSELSSDPYFE